MNGLFQPNAEAIFIAQSEAGECGLACLAMVSRHHGDQRDLSAFRRQFPTSTRGITLRDMAAIADQLGFHTRALKSDLRSLGDIALPAILHWDLNHYVVLSAVRGRRRGRRYVICDPGKGVRILDEAELADHFTGVVLEAAPSATFTPVRSAPKLRISQLWSRSTGVTPAIGRILALSLLMQGVSLVLPLFTQLAVDSALPASDLDLLNVLLLGFALILLLSLAATWLRARLVLALSTAISFQAAVNLFRHTIFLPVAWFERRHLGDIVSRFGSLNPISDLLSRGLVGALVDGVLSVTTLALMTLYAPGLAFISLSMVALYGVAKLAFYQTTKFANANVLSAQAVEMSAFIESMRGVNAIKMACQEGNRQRLWANKKSDSVKAALKLGRITNDFDTLSGAVVAIESLLTTFVAMRMVMAGDLSLGMVFAYQAYKAQFIGALVRLIDQGLNYRLLDVHLARIADVAFEPREPDDLKLDHGGVSRIEFQNVSYRYGVGLPYVLQNVNLSLDLDKTTAFVGASGSGKTTLLKLLCGLLQPTSGLIVVDGEPVQQYGTRRFRKQIGLVSQEDTLFSGSLAENIAFFDPDYDLDRIVRCCEIAAIHDDIQRMPMKYETLVGDMASNLSGGQRQRILLARALYRQPSVLCLDEGTAHLDVQTEAKVLGALKSMALTRIFVAHRPEAIQVADVVIHVTSGRAERVRFQPTH